MYKVKINRKRKPLTSIAISVVIENPPFYSSIYIERA